jgi:rRNA maturation endonuclease Nob1
MHHADRDTSQDRTILRCENCGRQMPEGVPAGGRMLCTSCGAKARDERKPEEPR